MNELKQKKKHTQIDFSPTLIFHSTVAMAIVPLASNDCGTKSKTIYRYKQTPIRHSHPIEFSTLAATIYTPLECTSRCECE